MHLVNMAGQKAKYKIKVDTLTIYATSFYNKYLKRNALQLWLCYGTNCTEGFYNLQSDTVIFLNYRLTYRQSEIIKKFVKRTAKKEGIAL